MLTFGPSYRQYHLLQKLRTNNKSKNWTKQNEKKGQVYLELILVPEVSKKIKDKVTWLTKKTENEKEKKKIAKIPSLLNAFILSLKNYFCVASKLNCDVVINGSA